MEPGTIGPVIGRRHCRNGPETTSIVVLDSRLTQVEVLLVPQRMQSARSAYAGSKPPRNTHQTSTSTKRKTGLADIENPLSTKAHSAKEEIQYD